MAPRTVEEALAFLQKKCTSNGDSVFLHLSHLIQEILETKAEDAVDLLETSMLLKRTRLLTDEKTNPGVVTTPDEEKFVQSFLQLFNVKIKPTADPEGEEEEEAPNDENNAEVADFWNESSFFEAVGIGVGQTETYYIVLAIKQLSSKPGISKVRFFGKFFGIKGNYFVFETNKLDDEEAEGEVNENLPEFGRPVDVIPKETEGTNAYLYWTCTKLGEAFIRLPDVTPLQIKTARTLTKLLTGNLDAEVSAYPPFPGVEKNYLRAQIARISATTVLAPKDFFVPQEAEEGAEPGENIEKNEEWTMPPVADLGQLDAWVHQNPHIKKQGRCSLYIPEAEPDEEGEEEEGEEETPKEEEEPDESPEILSSVENDANILDEVKPWSISFSSCVDGLKHKVVCLRSLLWPGAYTVSTKNGYSNVYIGWGIKNAPYEPPLPPDVQKEYEGELIESVELPPIPVPEVPAESEVELDEEGEQEEEED